MESSQLYLATSFEISPKSSKFGDMRRRRASLSSPEDPSGRGGLSPTLAACPGTFHDRPKALAAFADAPFRPCVGSLTRGRRAATIGKLLSRAGEQSGGAALRLGR